MTPTRTYNGGRVARFFTFWASPALHECRLGRARPRVPDSVSVFRRPLNRRLHRHARPLKERQVFGEPGIQGAYGYNDKNGGNFCKASDSTGIGGTSSAMPLAAGVAALMLSVNDSLPADQVREIMRDTCVQIDQADGNYNSEGWSEQYGYGRIDAYEAVRKAKSPADEGYKSSRDGSRLA